jgi:LytTr DNA-binding domain
MESDRPSRLQHYLTYRRYYEVALVLLVMAINSGILIARQMMDIERLDLAVERWEPYAWAYTSDAVTLVLIPFIILLCRRFPFSWRNLRIALPTHVLAAVGYWLIHSVGMTALRLLVYNLHSRRYEIGGSDLPWSHEFLVDVRAYAMIVIVVHAYRFILLRLQGEARILDAPDVGKPSEPKERPQRFLVRKLGKEFLVNVADIEWLEAQGNYVNLHVSGRSYPLRSTISGIEARLDPKQFVRVHRSHIINIACLVEIEPLDTGDARLKLKDGTVLACSRSYRDALRSAAQEGV